MQQKRRLAVLAVAGLPLLAVSQTGPTLITPWFGPIRVHTFYSHAPGFATQPTDTEMQNIQAANSIMEAQALRNIETELRVTNGLLMVLVAVVAVGSIAGLWRAVKA